MEPVAPAAGEAQDPQEGVPVREALRGRDTFRSGVLSRRRSIAEEAEAASDGPPPPPGNLVQSSISAMMSSAIGKWISTYVKALPKKTLPLPPRPASRSIYSIDNHAVLALAGDWGAGTEPALRVASGMAAHNPDLTIHLGDVYYSGKRSEYERIFVPSWPVGSGSGSAPKALALNGNHEMYSGGEGYFGIVVGPSGLYGQETSYFCLQNDHWRIVALDTGYKTPGWPGGDLVGDFLLKTSNTLPDENLEWLKDVIFADPSDRRPVVLLSHHQPIDAYGRAYWRMRRQIAPFLDRVAIWFWGHEHRLDFLAAAKVEGGKTIRGRCIGHGGKPVEPPKKKPGSKYPLVLTDKRVQKVQDGDQLVEVGYCGYVVLALAEDTLTIDYHEEPATKGTQGPLLVREVLKRAGAGGINGQVTHHDVKKLPLLPTRSLVELY